MSTAPGSEGRDRARRARTDRRPDEVAGDADAWLDRLAANIADAVEIDWDAPGPAAAATSPLGAFRLIARLADAHRSLREEPAPAHFRWGPLAVYEQVGEGAFGEVYRAWDPRLAIDVALKLHRADRPTFVAPALQEARGLARISHPNVVTVRGVDVHDGRVGLWTDFVRGPTLEAHATGAALDVAEVIDLVGAVARAVHAVHEAGYLHGDLTARNVLLAKGKTPVLVDFGAAAPLGADGTAATDLAGLTGTPLAMAPELFFGERPSVATDVYALGALAFRLLTGRHLVEGDSVDAVRRAHRRGHRRDLRALRADVPAPLAEAIERAVEPAGSSRFSSATELADALEAGRVPETNLVGRRSSFVGREKEGRALDALLLPATHVSLVGAGGAGKTRLAIEAAQHALHRFPDGVWIVDLAEVSAGEIASHIARTLRIEERSLRDRVDVIAEWLATRRALVVLDSCEHALDVVAGLLEAVHARGDGVTTLATSRERIGIESERVVDVGPLPVPPADDGVLDEIATVPSVSLFVDRAREGVATFELTTANGADVASICRHLDGLPLAIELAAAQLRSMPVDELARRVGEHLDLLVSPRRTAPERHRTLRALLDWSVDDLDDAARMLFSALSAFRGGWTLDDAVEFAALDEAAALDAHRTLVERSLVTTMEVGHSGTRFRFLEPVREYAADRLGPAADRNARRFVRHLHRKLSAGARAEAGPRDASYRTLVAGERTNATAALRTAIEIGEAACAAELSLALATEWTRRGAYGEAVEAYEALWTRRDRIGSPVLRADVWLAASAAFCDLHRHDDAERYVRGALEAVEAGASESHRMRAISQLGVIAQGRGQFDRCEAHWTEALALATRLGAERSRATCLGNLGIMRRWRGDLEAARVSFEEAETIFRALDLRDYAAYSRLNEAETRWYGGARVEALELARDATRELRVHGGAFHVVIALTLLARMTFLEERLEIAEAYAMEARAIARRAKLRQHYVLYALAAIAEWRGDPELAIELAVEALGEAHAKPGDVRSVLMLLAVAEGSRGDHRACAWMSACAAALRDVRSGEHDPANARLGSRLDDRLRRAREVLGAEAYDAARAEGAALDFSGAEGRIFAAYPGVPESG